ncbi:MAG TPA: flagellar basal body P-ring formation chaperone FlgA [Gemmatimonadales bacterium]|nr:flagellar basal body P-ring formation chaperone FlgA [Gemmatimonadales bacterium]
MRSCVRMLCVVGLLAGAVPAGAQSAAAPGQVPPGLAAQVAARVAALWAVAPETVRLEWGRRVFPSTLAESTPLRLLGRGDGGWFAVVFEPPGGPQLAARVRAGVVDSVAVATRPLPAGARLTPEDIATELRLHWGRAPSGSERPGAGWLVRRSIVAGTPLDSPVAVPPPLMRAGAPVRLLYTQGAVTVTLGGTALQDGRLGQRILVRPDGRRLAVSGTVADTDAVQLDPRRSP